ncbi:sedolisinlike peptidase [Acanthamoeba castellanii str. Neff]|uniref:Sedolisinlike peptidase n=1 Tax=Acanthamoeba castellanii (strain ATCC 30010 / Neff) TaxID=1257118 RepID=L8GZY2_ACACF|nr:sedolisinlike peptidase [Acanthamoeba castellanii str. Neff]ELR18532.1 sedolisinlike peptidase [Acanthamoeba castellanii str. Neff]
MSPTSLALALFLFVACTGTLTGSAAASIKFPYASADGAARYAGWVPTYTAAAAQSDLHRVTLYLTPSNPALLDPCSEAPPAIAGFYVQINSTNPAVGKSKSEWLDSQCTFNGNYTTCTGSVKAWLYDALNVSVAAAFENDHVGPSGYNPYPVLATPPIVPQNIWKQYNIPPNTLVTTNVTQCVVEFEQQYYSPSDLTLFLEQTGLPTDTPVTVIGPNYPNQPGGEANLDIQYIMGVAPGAPTVFWSIYANSTVEIDDILQWALQMSNTENPPQVNSLSYGMTEVNVDKYLGKGYLARADFEFKKLALRGITIIIASGDTGAGDLGDEPMAVPNCNTLHADWPSQSAYVTSVSSTIITPAAEPICYQQGVDCLDGPLGEIVVSVDQGLFWTTGGGFSNISARAPYQAQEVERYLNHKSITFPASGVWNPNGRAYPDVSAVGHNLMVALSGKFIPVDGTSASAPIFAGVVTLLNDARAAAGLPPLGFLNPMLYKARRERPQTFYDVTWGNNRCGALGFDPVCCPHGYHATDGWDAASGLGTPNFLELKEFVLQYPKAH